MTNWDVLAASPHGLVEDARVTAERFLQRRGLDIAWGVDATENVFRDESSLHNLWTTEMRRAMREWWEHAGGEAEYRNSIGTVQYRSVAFYSPMLFGGTYQSNKGWRVLALGLPIFGRVVFAFASHYQGGQNHNKLGAASRFLGERILAEFEDGGPLDNARVVSADDWDGPGLLGGVRRFGSKELPPEAPEPHLKDARNTTLKKVVASCMTIEIVDAGDVDERLDAYLAAGRRLQQ